MTSRVVSNVSNEQQPELIKLESKLPFCLKDFLGKKKGTAGVCDEITKDSLKQISCGKDRVFGLSKGLQLFELKEGGWAHVPSRSLLFKYGLVNYINVSRAISVGEDGSLFALNSCNKILYKLDDKTRQIDMALKNDGTKLAQIVAVSANQVWGLLLDGQVARFNGDSWEVLGGKMDKIAASNDELWGLHDGKAYRYAGSGWAPVSDMELSDICISKDSSVYGVTKSTKEISKWNANKFETCRSHADCKVSSICSVGNSAIFAVDDSGSLVRMAL
jgi:hypothetical protein